MAASDKPPHGADPSATALQSEALAYTLRAWKRRIRRTGSEDSIVEAIYRLLGLEQDTGQVAGWTVRLWGEAKIEDRELLTIFSRLLRRNCSATVDSPSSSISGSLRFKAMTLTLY